MATKKESTPPKLPTVIGATVVTFQRSIATESGQFLGGSKQEWGIGVLKDVGMSDIHQIIDMAGQVVPMGEVWDYQRITWRGSFVLDIGSEVE